MADIFTFSETLTFVSGYRLFVGGIGRKLEEIHIPFTNVTFLRDRGLVSAIIQAQGLEKFIDLALATTFKNDLAEMEGQTVTIEHTRLTIGGGFPAKCIITNRAGVNTNKIPGFHVEWTAQFRVFP